MATVVVDTSALIAVVTGEASRSALVRATRGHELVAPPSVHWEVGNAFSAMLKRKRIKLAQIDEALAAYAEIPLRFVDVDLADALGLAGDVGIYAYDAYVIVCARQQRAPLLSLDEALLAVARRAGVQVVEEFA